MCSRQRCPYRLFLYRLPVQSHVQDSWQKPDRPRAGRRRSFTFEAFEARENVQSFPRLSIRLVECRTFGVSHTPSLQGLSFLVSKCSRVYLHCCLGRVPSPDDASELPRELVIDSDSLVPWVHEVGPGTVFFNSTRG